MRAWISLGIAAVFVIAAALWLGSGVLVTGGHGPGEGETPIVALFSEQEGGGEHEELVEADGGEIDPTLTIAERMAQAEGNGADDLRSVRVETFNVQQFPLEVPLRGRTEAKTTVTVTPETSGVVRDVLVAKGDRVKEGDLLCRLDQGTREAAVAQAEAALAQAQTAYDSNAELRDRGVAAPNTRLQVESALKQAQSAVDNAKAELGRTDVVSNVAGVVQSPIANVGSMLAAGQPCATVVELDPMLFVGTVPEARIALARTGLNAEIETITGQKVEGTVSYIASVADDATRSFPVEIEIPNPDSKVLSGITATAVVNLGTMPAHLLPQSTLTLDSDGTLGVRAVDADDIVQFYPVNILSDTREGVWVSGLPATVDVITIGQEYVTQGQKVKPGSVAGDAETTTESVAS